NGIVDLGTASKSKSKQYDATISNYKPLKMQGNTISCKHLQSVPDWEDSIFSTMRLWAHSCRSGVCIWKIKALTIRKSVFYLLLRFSLGFLRLLFGAGLQINLVSACCWYGLPPGWKPVSG